MARAEFGESFPGGAVGKGNAGVIQNDFDPQDAPPVGVDDPSNTPPVEPETSPQVDLSELLPTFPPEHFLGKSEQEEDFPGDLPEIFDFI